MYKRLFVFWTLSGVIALTLALNSGFDFRRFLDMDFFWPFASVIGLGVLGFIVQSKGGYDSLDILFFRRIVRNVLFIVVGCYLLYVMYQSSTASDGLILTEEETKQWLTETGGTDWFAVAVNVLTFYFGAWALIAGTEKRFPNPLIFFDSAFCRKVVKLPKKSKVKK